MSERPRAGEIVGVDDDGPIVVEYVSRYPKEMMMPTDVTLAKKLAEILTNVLASKQLVNDLARSEVRTIVSYALRHVHDGRTREQLGKMLEETERRLDEVRDETNRQVATLSEIAKKLGAGR